MIEDSGAPLPGATQFPGATGKALVAAVDARLRLGAFDRLAEAGWRVDAVGDAVAVGRRLEKDHYDLIVTDLLEIPPTEISPTTPPAGGRPTRVVRVEPAILDDPEAWEAAIAAD